MPKLPKTTHCTVPGHGTRCEVAHDKAALVREKRTLNKRLRQLTKNFEKDDDHGGYRY